MMMPTGKSPAFEVVEPQFTFEVFVHALRSPALHDQSHELLLRSDRDRGEKVVCRLRFTRLATRSAARGVRAVVPGPPRLRWRSCGSRRREPRAVARIA